MPAGRPPFKPTAEHRKVVEAMSAYGIPQVDIARVIGVTKPTLEKYFRSELDTAATNANAKVAESLFQMATTKKVPAAAMFWMKCRAGWKETNALQLSGHDGQALPAQVVTVTVQHDLSKLSEEELLQLEAIMRKAEPIASYFRSQIRAL